RWPFTLRGLDVAGVRFDVQSGGQAQPLSYRSDFYVAGGARATFSGGLVFVGDAVPGADARGTLLRDRAVLINMPAGQGQQAFQTLNRARAAADSAGAGALIVILPPSVDAAGIAQSAAASERAARGLPSIPTFYLRTDRARELF